MKKKNILILGASGQDGSYLAHYLISRKHRVIGISRSNKKKLNHIKLGIENKIIMKNLNYNDYSKMQKLIINYNIDEIYFLSGQANPTASNLKILDTLYSNIIPVYNIIDIIINSKKKIKFFNASSCEIFNITNKKVNEESEKDPNSVYALSKLISFEMVKFFRQKFNLNICSGILFHHESVLRDKNFVIHKIVDYVKNKIGKKKLILGNIEISRDWGWAPEYVKIMYKVLNQKNIDDYIIASGKTVKLKYILNRIFKIYNLNWKNYVVTNNFFYRKYDSRTRRADISKSQNKLGFKVQNNIDEILKKLIFEKLF